MESRLVRLDREQLDRLREKVTVKPGVVIYRKPPWLHALWGEGRKCRPLLGPREGAVDADVLHASDAPVRPSDPGEHSRIAGVGFCDGSGTIFNYVANGAVQTRTQRPCPGCRKCRPCKECEGKGYNTGTSLTCPRCHGSGVEPK